VRSLLHACGRTADVRRWSCVPQSLERALPPLHETIGVLGGMHNFDGVDGIGSAGVGGVDGSGVVVSDEAGGMGEVDGMFYNEAQLELELEGALAALQDDNQGVSPPVSILGCLETPRRAQ